MLTIIQIADNATASGGIYNIDIIFIFKILFKVRWKNE